LGAGATFEKLSSTSLSSGIFPGQLKIVEVVPVFKSKDES